MIVNAKDSGSVKYFTRSSNALPGFGALSHMGITPTSTQNTEVQAFFPYYADQLPPFNVSITFANEYGQAAKRSIYGVEIINEGSGASMDDIQLEETMTFVARDLGPMVATDITFTKPATNFDITVVQETL